MILSKKCVIACITFVFLSSSIAFGAGERERTARTAPDTLVVGYPMDIASFDVMANTREPHPPRMLVFDPFVAFDEEFIPQPHLATSWEISDDELTWTFELREGVEFHDGTPMTSADVVASWDRYAEMGARSWEFEDVDEVVAVDDYTVEFRLNKPFGALLNSLAMPQATFVVYPEWVIDEIGTDELVEVRHIVGTGPYMIEEIVIEERYLFRRYDNYTQPGIEPSFAAGNRNAPMEYIEVRIIPDPATRVAALEAGDMDLVHTVPVDDADRLVEDPALDITRSDQGMRLTWRFNSGRGPFADPMLRDAVRTALDAEAILSAIGSERYWRVNHALRWQEEQWMWSDAADEYYENNLDKAREMVEQSDYEGEIIRILASPDRPHEFRMVVPMEQLLREGLGLNVEIVSVDAATFASLRRNRDEWEIKHSGGASIVSLKYLDSHTRDRAGERWVEMPDEWDETLEALLAATADEVRVEKMERLHEIFNEVNLELFVGEVFRIAGHRTNVRGVSESYFLWLWNTYKE